MDDSGWYPLPQSVIYTTHTCCCVTTYALATPSFVRNLTPSGRGMVQPKIHQAGSPIIKYISMKNLSRSVVFILCVTFIFSGCAANKTKKGAAVGAVSGGAMGAVIGRASGNMALGTIIGATVGGTAGALIGHKMDKQAEELKKTVPDAKVERVGEGIIVEFSSDVLFGFDKSDLSSNSKASLEKLVEVLNVYPDTDIEVQGHTDSKGSQSYNQSLSERRAGTTADFIRNHGIGYSRVRTKGFGESVPKYNNNTSSGQAQNRRVEFLITANEKMKADASTKSLN